jgi:hypothetical protein
MTLINVAEIVSDTDFTQPVIRIIRNSTVNQFGEPVVVEKRKTIQCVVTNPSDAELTRFQESSSTKKMKRFTTTTKLNAGNEPGNGDIILYKRTHYLIVGVDDYEEFGYNRGIGIKMENAVPYINK